MGLSSISRGYTLEMKKSKNHILTIVEFPSQSSMSGSAKILIAIKLYQALFFQMGHLYLERKRNLFLTSLKQTCNEYLYLNINKCKLAFLGEQENISMFSTCSKLLHVLPSRMIGWNELCNLVPQRIVHFSFENPRVPGNPKYRVIHNISGKT